MPQINQHWAFEHCLLERCVHQIGIISIDWDLPGSPVYWMQAWSKSIIWVSDLIAGKPPITKFLSKNQSLDFTEIPLFSSECQQPFEYWLQAWTQSIWESEGVGMTGLQCPILKTPQSSGILPQYGKRHVCLFYSELVISLHLWPGVRVNH